MDPDRRYISRVNTGGYPVYTTGNPYTNYPVSGYSDYRVSIYYDHML